MSSNVAGEGFAPSKRDMPISVSHFAPATSRLFQAIVLFIALALLTPLSASASVYLATPNTNALSTGLVGYWSMDDNTINWNTNTISDLSGQGNAGTLVSMSTTTAPVAGKIGGALKFNGSSALITANGETTSFVLNTSWTTSAWFLSTSTSEEFVGFFGNTTNTTPTLGFGSLNQLTTGQILAGGRDNAGNVLNIASINATYNDGKWHQVVATYSGNLLSLYVDGVLNSTGTISWGPATYNTFTIGAAVRTSTQFYWSGKIDDVRIYNRALSTQEVALLYALGTIHADNTPATNSSFSIDQGGLNGGLVAYWPLDGNTTNWTKDTTADVSGNSNTGTLVNMSTSTSPTAGKIGGALKFNGSNTYISTAYTVPAQNSGTSFTWSTWAYVNPTANGNLVILGNRGGGGATWIKLTPTAFEYSGGLISHTIPTGQWVFLAVTKNGTNFTYYQNGVAIGTGSSSGSTSAYTFYMGEDPGFTGDGDFTGMLDDVRIYNRALSAQEIAQLYTAGKVNVDHSNTVANTGITSSLIGYWTFDGPSINWRTNVVSDMSGNGNAGTLVNISTSSSPTAGKIGQALKFNGTNYVDIPMSLTPSTITVSLWFRASSLTGSASGNPRLLANSHTDASDTGFQLMFNSGGASGFFDVGNGSAECRATWTQQLVVGQWYQYAGVYNGSQAIAYLNGVPVGSTSGCSGALASSGFDVDIGRNSAYSPNDYFSGTIDDVRIYNRALSAQEIQELYQMSH
jgi:Concanavalin A-like lectin/glucanases superfamily